MTYGDWKSRDLADEYRGDLPDPRDRDPLTGRSETGPRTEEHYHFCPLCLDTWSHPAMPDDLCGLLIVAPKYGVLGGGDRVLAGGEMPCPYHDGFEEEPTP